MTYSLSEIWRHPIKAVGRERVTRAILRPDEALPWDRHWAIAHEAARLTDGWNACRNFIRAASSPRLMAVSCTLDEESATLTLRHPDQPDITVAPDADPEALIAWLRPLSNPDRPAPAHVVALPGRGFTDSGTAGVTIGSLASHKALEARIGRPLSRHRWRANLWIDGLDPWQEFEWVDREIRIGEATLLVYGRTERCRATEANPDTGQRDTDTLGALRELGHQDFTVKAKVITEGAIFEGAELQL